MSETFSILLTGPAKVGGKRRKAGETVEVDQGQLDQLTASGVVADQSSSGARIYTEAEFHAKLKELVAESDERINASLGEDISRLKAERDEAIAQVDGQRELVSTLEGQVTALNEQLAMAHNNLAQLTGRAADAVTNTETSPDGQAGGEQAGADTAQPQSGAAPASQNTPPTEKATKTAQKRAQWPPPRPDQPLPAAAQTAAGPLKPQFKD